MCFQGVHNLGKNFFKRQLQYSDINASQMEVESSMGAHNEEIIIHPWSVGSRVVIGKW